MRGLVVGGIFFFTSVLALGSSDSAARLRKVSAWHYQLQGYDSAPLLPQVGRPMLYVLDYSKNGSESQRFTRDEIDRLRMNGQNIVLAYLSIGEAEESRWYYKKFPKKFLGPATSEYPDNPVVQYWRPAWRQVLLGRDGYLRRILAAGFDGVYLDRIDAFYRFPKNKNAASQMIRLVLDVARAARKIRPDALVFGHNAPCILNDENLTAIAVEKDRSKLRRKYLAALDGIGLESLFFAGKAFEDNPFSADEEALRCLAFLRSYRQLPVFALEYVRKPDSIARAWGEFSTRKIIGLVTDRALTGAFIRYAK